MAAIERVAASAPPADCRGLLPGASGDSRRPRRRNDRRRGRVQLLSDQESRRARRWRRGRHQRSAPSPSASGGSETAARRIAITIRKPASIRGSTRCRRPSCAARLPWLARWTDRRRELAARYRTALAGGPVDIPPSAIRAMSITCSSCGQPRVTTLQSHLAAAGVETLIHYPLPIPTAARVPGRCGPLTVPGRRARLRRRCSRCPFTRRWKIERRRRRWRRAVLRGHIAVRALITGGAGFIGSHLAEALLDPGTRRARSSTTSRPDRSTTSRT